MYQNSLAISVFGFSFFSTAFKIYHGDNRQKFIAYTSQLNQK